MASLEALLRLLGQPASSQAPSDADAEGRELESLALSLARQASAGDGARDPASPPDASLRDVFLALVRERVLAEAYRAPPGADRAAPPGRVLRVLQCSRLVLRDERFVDVLLAVDGAVVALGAKFETYAALHFAPPSSAPPAATPPPSSADPAAAFAFRDEILGELASVFKKLASAAATCPWRSIRDAGAHRVAVTLLPTRDASLLASALVILRAREHEEDCQRAILEGDGVDHLLLTLREYGAPFRHLAADVVRAACRLEEGRDECRRLGGVAATCDALRAELEGRDAFSSRGRGDFLPATRETTASGSAEGSEDGRVAFDWSAAEALLRLLGGVLVDRDAAAEARDAGAIAALVATLREPPRAGARGFGAPTSAAAACLACSALTKLSADDAGAAGILRQGGVYALGRLLVTTRERRRRLDAPGPEPPSDSDAASRSTLLASDLDATSAHAFRAMRHVFGVERCRRAFKTLFPPDLFAAFIDVGHYAADLAPYRALASMWHSVADADAAATAEALEDPAGGARGGAAAASDEFASSGGSREVRGFRLVELIGRGAFGAVFRAIKRGDEGRGGGGWRAIKELDPTATRDAPDEDGGASDPELSAARVASEVDILSRLDHPNVVKYHESFRDGNAVYIVMDLVEGASLLEHIRSVEARGRRVAESFAWDCFSQLALALRYIHEDKGVVHRDLTPGNVLLERDARDPTSENQIRVKLADFGLAKASRPRTAPVRENRSQTGGETKSNSNANLTNASTRFDAVMQSAVGTMPYSCPEIIKHEPYDHKADVWSLGCVLYHLLALRPPFDGSNPLTCASAVVEGRYAPLDASTRERYSDALRALVPRLLTAEPTARPSIADVVTACAPTIARALDRARADVDRLDAALARERRRSAADAATARRKRDALIRALGSSESRSSGRGGSRMSAAAYEGGDDVEGGRGGARDAAREGPGAGPGAGAGAGAGGGFASARRRSEIFAAPPPPAGVRIAPARLRPVADPTSQILATLHKLVYLDQLPPAPGRKDARLAAVRRFKRRLFGGDQNPGTIKARAAKLAAGTSEATEEGPGEARGAGGEEFATFEALGKAVEALVVERGFYDSQRAASR
jgi:serine/threonine protein kinase